MRLKLKLVLLTTALTFGIVLALSLVFLSEIVRQRIEQTISSDDVLAHQVLMATRKAVEDGLQKNPPQLPGEEAFQTATMDALRADESLRSLMDSIVRYSPTVQDVTVTNAHRAILVSTDAVLLNQSAPYRMLLSSVPQSSIFAQARLVFGSPQVLDVPLSLDRNGQPFLIVHLGVRSSLLRNSYLPLLRASILFSVFAILGCILAAAILSAVALRPIEEINRRLEILSAVELPEEKPDEAPDSKDAVVRASDTIDRLGKKIRVSEEQQTTLRANLNKMLSTLKDGVLLFTTDDRAVMASEAIAHFLPAASNHLVNEHAEDIFSTDSPLDQRVREAFRKRESIANEAVRLANLRTVDLSLHFIQEEGNANTLGALLTLHDAEAEQELEQEIEVARRLAAIGRLTAGVGHEVKNPINAMVVHLELLRSKLNADTPQQNAIRHVDILSSEMQRLDRVVQTLADFSRPLDLQLRDVDLNEIVRGVIDLASAEMELQGIYLDDSPSPRPLLVRADVDLMRQALLNILLNAVQAMDAGGNVHVHVTSDQHAATVSIRDHGTGIPEEAQARIFDLYFTTKPRGSGIGLSMTYRIVQLHGGSISFESDADESSTDRGTEFTIRLPLAHKLVGAPQLEERKQHKA